MPPPSISEFDRHPLVALVSIQRWSGRWSAAAPGDERRREVNARVLFTRVYKSPFTDLEGATAAFSVIQVDPGAGGLRTPLDAWSLYPPRQGNKRVIFATPPGPRSDLTETLAKGCEFAWPARDERAPHAETDVELAHQLMQAGSLDSEPATELLTQASGRMGPMAARFLVARGLEHARSTRAAVLHALMADASQHTAFRQELLRGLVERGQPASMEPEERGSLIRTAFDVLSEPVETHTEVHAALTQAYLKSLVLQGQRRGRAAAAPAVFADSSARAKAAAVLDAHREALGAYHAALREWLASATPSP